MDIHQFSRGWYNQAIFWRKWNKRLVNTTFIFFSPLTDIIIYNWQKLTPFSNFGVLKLWLNEMKQNISTFMSWRLTDCLLKMWLEHKKHEPSFNGQKNNLWLLRMISVVLQIAEFCFFGILYYFCVLLLVDCWVGELLSFITKHFDFNKQTNIWNPSTISKLLKQKNC